jgi:hypothetical protein
MTDNPMYALRHVPGKGRGLVAIKKIPRGTRILSEEPIITVPRGKPDSEGLQTSICLINHACDNNAQKNWNEEIKRHTVHALRDICEGEEITIYYLGVYMNYKARQEALQEKFGFMCVCRLCFLPPEQSQESDRRLDEINRLDVLISQAGGERISSSPLQILRYVDQQVRLYNEQGLDDSSFPRAFLDAAQIAIANGDLARGRIFMERAVSGWATSHGDDSTEVIKYRAITQDPSTHTLYGLSEKWRTTVDEVPRGLEPSDFEDWLWRREYGVATAPSQKPGQLADLRRRATFPGFVDLPRDDSVDQSFYQSRDKINFWPRRHWCFLGEISDFAKVFLLDFAKIFHLEMKIKDVDGRIAPLHFLLNELAPSQFQRGNTVAVLYAQRHAFKGQPGILLEDHRAIKVPQIFQSIPLSLIHVC